MRIDGIEINDFLSFRSPNWPAPDRRLNLVVGPNGAGKTNLVRAFRAVADAFDDSARASWENAAYDSSSAGFSIAIDIALTGAEQELLCAFVAAALCDEMPAANTFQQLLGRQPEPDYLTRLSALVQQSIRPEGTAWLFTGRLVVSFTESGRWRVSYESRGRAARFRWLMEDWQGPVLTTRSDDRGIPRQQFFQHWWSVLSEERRRAIADFVDGAGPAPELSGLLRTLSEHKETGGLALQAYLPASGVRLPTHEAVARLSGIDLEPNHHHDVRHVVRRLLRSAFVFLDETRTPLRRRFDARELQAALVDLSSGDALALYLFQKQSGSAGDRTVYAEIKELFQGLTRCEFDVRLGEPPRRRVGAPEQEDTGAVWLDASVSNGWREAPIALAGSGIREALLLSTRLAGSDGRVVLSDEPATNLQPPVQRDLLGRIGTTPAGRTDPSRFFVITHSPELVPADDITRTSRLYMRGGATARAALDVGLSHENLARLTKRLRRSLETRALLFDRAVVLIEGETETGALPIRYRKECGRSLEHAGIALASVDGHSNFGVHGLLLRQFAVPDAIVCDGKAIGETGRSEVRSRLRIAGIDALPDLGGQGFTERREVLCAYGVFTTAESATDEFENLPVVAGHQDEARRAVGESKPRQGRYIAERYPCPPEVARVLEQLHTYLVRVGVLAAGAP